MEKKNRLPDYDVWVYGMADEVDLEMAVKHGIMQKVQMIRRYRPRCMDSLNRPVSVELKVLSVRERKRASRMKRDAGYVHHELAVEVEMVNDAPKGSTISGLDDGLGLSAFTAGTKFTLVYFPDDHTRMARVSRGSDVLYVGMDE